MGIGIPPRPDEIDDRIPRRKPVLSNYDKSMIVYTLIAWIVGAILYHHFK